MKLRVKNIKQKIHTVEIEPEASVGALKTKLGEIEDVPADHLRLIYSGRILSDEQTLAALEIKENDFLVSLVIKPKTAAPPVVSPAAQAPQAAAQEEARESNLRPLNPANDLNESAINSMVEMGFPRDQVCHAMRAAFNNPDRAYEYLENGIPQEIEQLQAVPPSRAEPAPPTRREPAAAPQNLFNLAQQMQQQQQMGRAGMEAAPDMASLMAHPQFEQFRQILAANPAMLRPLLQQVAESNPQLLEAMGTDQTQLLNDLAAEMGLATDQAMLEREIEALSEEEKQAIERLVALGFARSRVIEAYMICDKNEEEAANFLCEDQ